MQRSLMSFIHSFLMEVGLKARSILLTFALAFLLLSCSSDGRSALVSSEGAEVYIEEKGSFLMVDIDKDTLSRLCELSAMDCGDVISDLFGAEVSETDGKSYIERRRLFSLLETETGSADRLSALKKNGKDLRKTEFMNTINELSGSFDDNAELERIINSGSQAEYSLAPVLSENAWDYERVKEFINIWVSEAVR